MEVTEYVWDEPAQTVSLPLIGEGCDGTAD
jgi:hypothetical protein